MQYLTEDNKQKGVIMQRIRELLEEIKDVVEIWHELDDGKRQWLGEKMNELSQLSIAYGYLGRGKS